MNLWILRCIWHIAAVTRQVYFQLEWISKKVIGPELVLACLYLQLGHLVSVNSCGLIISHEMCAVLAILLLDLESLRFPSNKICDFSNFGWWFKSLNYFCCVTGLPSLICGQFICWRLVDSSYRLESVLVLWFLTLFVPGSVKTPENCKHFELCPCHCSAYGCGSYVASQQ